MYFEKKYSGMAVEEAGTRVNLSVQESYNCKWKIYQSTLSYFVCLKFVGMINIYSVSVSEGGVQCL